MKKYGEKIFEFQLRDSYEVGCWNDPTLREPMISGFMQHAKDKGRTTLRISDPEGSVIFTAGTELWETMHETISDLDTRLEAVRAGVKKVQALVRESVDAHTRGNLAMAHHIISEAMDVEFALFAECPYSGNDELLTYLGYDLERYARKAVTLWDLLPGSPKCS